MTKVVLGAASMLSNGAALSRVGTVRVCACVRLVACACCAAGREHGSCGPLVTAGAWCVRAQGLVATVAASFNKPVLFCVETYKVRAVPPPPRHHNVAARSC